MAKENAWKEVFLSLKETSYCKKRKRLFRQEVNRVSDLFLGYCLTHVTTAGSYAVKELVDEVFVSGEEVEINVTKVRQVRDEPRQKNLKAEENGFEVESGVYLCREATWDSIVDVCISFLSLWVSMCVVVNQPWDWYSLVKRDEDVERVVTDYTEVQRNKEPVYLFS